MKFSQLIEYKWQLTGNSSDSNFPHLILRNMGYKMGYKNVL